MNKHRNNLRINVTLIVFYIAFMTCIKAAAQDTLNTQEQFEYYDAQLTRINNELKEIKQTNDSVAVQLITGAQRQATSHGLVLAGGIISVIGFRAAPIIPIAGAITSAIGFFISWESWRHIRMAGEKLKSSK